MNSILTDDTAASDRALQQLLSLHRRICLLRHQGQPQEAERLALAELHPATEALLARGHVSRAQLMERCAAETSRVDEAALLAALIAPMLCRPTAPGSAHRPRAATPEDPSPDQPRPSHAPHDVAAFIDDMLAQHRARPRA